jgi:hypothetical protein
MRKRLAVGAISKRLHCPGQDHLGRGNALSPALTGKEGQRTDDERGEQPC